jgi:predicted lipoprotein with Yx(FWY)xxD motif
MRLRLKVGLVVLVLIAAACGGDDEGESVGEVAALATTAAPATTVAPTTAAPEPLAGETVVVAASAFGDMLVDGAGNTLYLFVPDAQDASVCYDDCANAWPPLGSEVVAGDGVDAGLLGSVARDDGSEQATYNGWPLYYFANDAAAGDTNGQGINDVWYVLDSAGEAVTG